MERKQQIILCSILFVLGLLGFILQIFIFEAPNGFLGFILCLLNIYLIIGSVVKLCKLSKKFKSTLLDALDILFFIR